MVFSFMNLQRFECIEASFNSIHVNITTKHLVFLGCKKFLDPPLGPTSCYFLKDGFLKSIDVHKALFLQHEAKGALKIIQLVDKDDMVFRSNDF